MSKLLSFISAFLTKSYPSAFCLTWNGRPLDPDVGHEAEPSLGYSNDGDYL